MLQYVWLLLTYLLFANWHIFRLYLNFSQLSNLGSLRRPFALSVQFFCTDKMPFPIFTNNFTAVRLKLNHYAN